LTRSVEREARRLLRQLTGVLVVIALAALAFTATNVTLFAIRHGVSSWIAWMLDPMVSITLGTVLVADGLLSDLGIGSTGWATALRWFAGCATWVMNCWSSIWPTDHFGVPHQVDVAGLVLHSVPPVLLIGLAEAVSHYRRKILAHIAALTLPAASRGDTPGVPSGTATVPPAGIGVPLTVPSPLTAVPPSVPPPAAPAVAAASAASPASSPTAFTLVRSVDSSTVPPAVPAVPGGVSLVKSAVPLTVPPAVVEPVRLSTEEAWEVIQEGWERGRSIRETAELSTRSPAYVGRVYQQLTQNTDAAQSEPVRA
jgi:hypothetical protein